MFLAKISPSAKIAKQSSAFENPVIIEADHIQAFARPYELGAESVRFEVRLGNLVEDNGKQEFKQISDATVVLTSDELNEWGTSDGDCFKAIAKKLNVACDSFVTL